jgi:hypothetical protein
MASCRACRRCCSTIRTRFRFPSCSLLELPLPLLLLLPLQLQLPPLLHEVLIGRRPWLLLLLLLC